jgi:hypothetical protein
MSEPNCDSVEMTLAEAPPCPACEEMYNAPYTIELGEGVWTEFGPRMIPPGWGVTIISADDRHHVEILATALDEQGCRDDAELVRRLAGLTTPGASGPM